MACKLLCLKRISRIVVLFVAGSSLCTAWSQGWQQSTSVGGGTLTWTVTQSSGTCGPTGYGWSYTQWNFGSFQFSYQGTTYPLNGYSVVYLQDNNGTMGCPPNGPQPSVLPIQLPSNFGVAAIEFTAQSGGYGGAFVQSTTIYNPAYKVTSVLYSPPGNQSSQGYTNTTTNGTTTTVGNSFTYAQQLTFSSGIPNVIGGSASWGYSSTTSNSAAFTQTWSDATGIATDDNSNPAYNPTASNAINHHLDTFEIWLNPQVTVVANGSTPINYSMSSQPTPGVSSVLADVVSVPAIAMEPIPGSISPSHPSGISSVEESVLNQQAIATSNGNTYMPGLASICKNLNVAEYQAHACTKQDQCGCTPADFAPILAQDPLLNYNTSTYTANPYPGTTDPTVLDGSGQSICEQNPIPTNADCRYIIVPFEKGSTTPQFEPLSGSQALTYQQSDTTTSTFTTGSSTSNSVSVSFTAGPFFAQLKDQDTWTWTDMESTASTNGQGNTMSLTLKTSTAGCQENVNLFEDTVFHTFVFQVPSGNFGCN